MSISLNIKTVINNLKNQFLNDPTIASLVDNKVFISADILDYIGALKLPLINIEFNTLEINEADNMNLSNFERHTYNLFIQFAISDKNREAVLIGNNKLLDMYEAIINAIKSDETLNGAVDEFIKANTFNTDIFPPITENLIYVAGGELSISFSKDVFLS